MYAYHDPQSAIYRKILAFEAAQEDEDISSKKLIFLNFDSRRFKIRYRSAKYGKKDQKNPKNPTHTILIFKQR